MRDQATVRSVLEHATGVLADAGVPDPSVDAQLLLAHVLSVRRGEVRAAAVSERPLAPEHAEVYAGLVERRARREPLQHIVGTAPFRSLELRVGPGVFVPRPETETVVDIAIAGLRASAETDPIAVDLGTGSGAIALSLAHEVPDAVVYAIERSPEAFAWARRNLAETGVTNMHLVQGDLATAFPELDGQVSVVISNPPYIPTDAIPRDPEVHLHDPGEALYGGADGLDVIRAVVLTARRLLRAGGLLVVEHGDAQGEIVAEVFRAAGWRSVSSHRDLTGRPRATTALR